MPVQTNSQTRAPHRVTCRQCGATIAIYLWMDECACPQCGTRHLVRIIDSPRYQMVLAQPLVDAVDETAARRILHEGELELRTLMLEIEQNVLAAQQLMREGEREAAYLQQPGRQSRESLAQAGTLAAVSIALTVSGVGLLSCLAFPFALAAVYVQWQARQQLAEENRRRRSALDRLTAKRLAELRRIQEETERLEARLAAGPSSAK